VRPRRSPILAADRLRRAQLDRAARTSSTSPTDPSGRLARRRWLSEAFERIARSQISGATCMLAVVLPRYPREAEQVLAFARERGLQIVLVTDSRLAPLAGTGTSCCRGGEQRVVFDRRSGRRRC